MKFPARDACVVGALLERWARERPDAVLFEFTDRSTWSFAETLALTRRAAAGLRALGVRRGSHVLSWLPNAPEALLTWFGANYLGAVYVPMNTAYRGALLEHVIGLSEAEVLVASRALLPRLLRDLARPMCATLSSSTGRRTRCRRRRRRWTNARSTGCGCIPRIRCGQRRSPSPTQPVEPWDVNYVMFNFRHDRSFEGGGLHLHPGLGGWRDGDGLLRSRRPAARSFAVFPRERGRAR